MSSPLTLLLATAVLFVPMTQILADSSTTTELLWPLPRMATFGSSVYSIDPASFQFLGMGSGGASALLKGAFDRYIQLIFHSPPPFYPSGGGGAPAGVVDSVTVNVASSSEDLGPNTDESYNLLVTSSKGTITANTVYGAIRGLETFSQLVYRNPDDSLAINEVNVTDYPRFKFRGSMIDTSRHYLSINTILNHLDAMSYSKFNVLHWHITDDQSFPYESSFFPNMSLKGAFDNNHVYTREMIAAVIDYAKVRGIRVIVEFDTPGHTQSWGLGQPGLLTQCYSSGKPDGSFGPINPILDTTWTFLKAFFFEVAGLFPDPYLHMGGDEVSFACWESNPGIQQWMKEHNYTDYSKLEQHYETTLLELIASLNKQYIVWQEIFDNGLKVLPNTVIDVWKSGWQAEMNKVTAGGLHAIMSSCWYLNYISYGDDWTKYYMCDPQNFGGTADQEALVLGGEACMWSEFVDSTNFLTRYWPRAASVGERLWSDATVNNTDTATPRLLNFRCRMISRGIPAEPILRGGFCATEWHDIPPK